MSEGDFIAISHFINPQLFWYHKVDGRNPELIATNEIGNSLQSFCTKKSFPQGHYRPKEGEIVAIAFVSWNRFIRARVEEVAKYIRTEDEYVVWAIDYGFPFKTKLCHIRKIPDDLTILTNHICLGGLGNILPAEMDFDFVTLTSKLVTKNVWGARAVEMLEKVINDSASISFIESFSVNGPSEKHNFGDLKIVNHSGQEFLASEFLIKLNLAVKCEDNFCDKLATLKTTKIPCFLKNNEEMKIIDNKLNNLNINIATNFNLSGTLSDPGAFCDTYAQQKVIDWCKRNQNFDEKESEKDAACPSFAIDATDIAFDDSVSVQDFKQNALPEGEEETVMGYAGKVHETRKKQYEGKKLPPKPSLEVFEVITSKKTETDVSSSVKSTGCSIKGMSARIKARLEKQKLNQESQSKECDSSSQSASVRSEVGTAEFLEKCRTKNANSKMQANLLDDNNSANECLIPESQSEVSSESNLQEKMTTRLSNENEKHETNSDKHSSTDTQSKAISKNSAYAQSKIELRRRLKTKSSARASTNDEKNEETHSDMHTLADTQSNEISKNCSYAQSKIELRRKKKEKYLQERQEYGTDINETGVTVSSTVKKHGYVMPTLCAKFKGEKKESSPAAPCLSIENPIVIDSSPPEEVQQPPEVTKDQNLPDLRKLLNENPFKNMTVVPAGFNVANLTKRRNEASHWHTTKSTFNESFGSNSSHSSYNSSKKSIPRRTEDIEEQNFRLTRSRKERKKENSENINEKHILDLSLVDIDCPPITPATVASEPRISETQDLIILDNSLKSEESEELRNESNSFDSFLKLVDDNSRQRLIETSYSGSDDNSMEKMKVSVNMNQLKEELKNLNYDEKSIITSSSPSSSSFVILNNEKDDKENAKKCKDLIKRSPAPSESIGDNKESKEDVNKKLSLSMSSLGLSPVLSSRHESLENSQVSIPIQKKAESPLFKLEKSAPESKQIKDNNLEQITNEAPLKTNFVQHLLLAHSTNEVIPIDRMQNALFSPEIHRAMEHMRANKLYRIQSYAWPHLLRGNSFFVVNASRTGKTWCYLPAICNTVSYRLENDALPESHGPAVIVIAPSSVQVESIARYCRRLLVSSKVSVVQSFGYRSRDEIKIELHNGCGILIITPPILQRILDANEKESLLNFERILSVVVDGIDMILKQSLEFNEMLQRLVGPVLRIQEKNKTNFQFIVTSQIWMRRLMNIMKIGNHPLLCIGDYLEAAVYGKAKVSIKLQSSDEKLLAVTKCLNKCSYGVDRVVIVCNSAEEVYSLEASLIDVGYACLIYTDQMDAEHIEYINEWKTKTICHQLLITSDSVLPELIIQNAWTLIHYSMPSSWTKFNFRFSVFLNNFQNMLIDSKKPTKVPKSLILLDENNNLQLPRLIEFMKNHSQLKYIHPDILTVAERVTAEREESRVALGIKMCPKILEFSSCDEPNRCKHRHQLTKYDRPEEGYPTQGEIRLEILNVLSPVHYTARLLSHKKHNNWEVVRLSNQYQMFLLKMFRYFMDDDAQMIHWPLRVNDICVYRDENKFHRCRLIEVPVVQYENIVKQVNVEIKLIDSGLTLTSKSCNILVIPEEFKNFPAQATDIRLSGVIPFDNERVWDSRSTHAVKHWIMTDIIPEEVLQGSIDFVLSDTIWVSNLVVMEKLPTISGYAVKLNLRRSLLGKEFALPDNEINLLKHTAIKNNFLQPNKESDNEDTLEDTKNEKDLLEFSMNSEDQQNDCNLLIPFLTPTTSSPPKKDVIPEISSGKKKMAEKVLESLDEEWSTLEIDELVQVRLAEITDFKKFYIRLLSNENDLKDLEDVIKNHKKVQIEDPYPMQNCLAIIDGRYQRAKIQSLITDSDFCIQARVFFCDLGVFSTCPLDKLYSSSKDILEYIPFQAICCKLTGVNLECEKEDIEKIIQIQDSAHMAYAVKEISNANDHFKVKKYEILFYQCFVDKNDIQINKMLVEQGLASYDDDTKHFLELETQFDAENFDCEMSYDFQSFLERIKQQMEEEDADEEEEYERDMKKSYQKNSTNKSFDENVPEELKIEEIIDDEDEKCVEPSLENTYLNLPALRGHYKHPQTTWYETMSMIYFVIRAPDIVDYSLEVYPQRLIFSATINGDENVLILNFLGLVEPSLVTHEIRGLNVVVRLVKSVQMMWPRLLQDTIKMPWLTYNYNAINASEEDTFNGSLPIKRRINYSSESSCASDTNPLETFTPIVNVDELQDPMQEIF